MHTRLMRCTSSLPRGGGGTSSPAGELGTETQLISMQYENVMQDFNTETSGFHYSYFGLPGGPSTQSEQG